jgi:predicted dehydrogenase
MRKVSANDKINIAGIGAGGKGSSDIDGAVAAGDNNLVALCDVDWKRAAEKFKKYPNAKQYKDFRELLDKEYKNIDAVTISTPDHMHAPIAMAAMQLGKHVYVQKPLTHDVYEARRLREAAKKYNVQTQMGNQGHSAEGVRRLCEWIWDGAIGTVHEAHIWTDRPIWPQGIKRPAETSPIPETLAWDLWLGTAPKRPYHEGTYCPFKWRGWWDFGCGALGDMACHIMDPSYTALKLTYPTSIEAVSEGGNEETAPKWSIITYQFPAEGNRPAVKIVWYDGGKQPPRPEGVGPDEKLGDGDNGTLFVGDKGMLACGCYGGGPTLLPRSRMEEYKRPAKTIPNSTGHYQEWIDRIKGVPTPAGGFSGDFDYACPFTEMVLLGNLAVRVGKPIQYDPANMRVTNEPDANKYLRREYTKEYRQYA